MSLLSGASAGITYGAAGIYSWHTTNKGFEASLGEGFATPKCWQQALCFDGAWDYGYIKYIFERFYRVDESRSKNTGGIGVGLTIVKSIIDLHQGTIEVRSELNKGSEFIVILPNL